MTDYLFESERLGFRTWVHQDLSIMSKINSDQEVMKYFPSKVNEQETAKWIKKQNKDYDNYGYCYYAVDLLEGQELIGFIGLSYKELNTNFSPCTDIGWRLSTQHQGNSFATEGAKRCLSYAFEKIQLNKVVAIAPEINKPSIKVMQKIGMQFSQHFEHPALLDYPDLKRCLLYKIIEKGYSSPTSS